ncbi:MAG: hypothetical protein WC747_00150 [Candidatus Babeliales bacterium]|jgi:hypothetical protein
MKFKIFTLLTVFSFVAFAEELKNVKDSVTFVSSETFDNEKQALLNQEQKEQLSCMMSLFLSDEQESLTISEIEARKRGAFLLTGVIVYQTSRVVGHVGVWVSAGAMIVGGTVTGGPAGGGAAYLAALTMVGPASAAVETGSLALGTIASFIPGLP